MESEGLVVCCLLFILIILSNFIVNGFGVAIRKLNDSDPDDVPGFSPGLRKHQKLTNMLERKEIYMDRIRFTIAILHMGLGILALIGLRLMPGGDFLTTLWKAGVLIVFFYLVFVFSYFLPRRIANLSPVKWAYGCIDLAAFLLLLTYPLFILVDATTIVIMHLVGLSHKRVEEDVTEDEIIQMVNEGHEQGNIEASEAEMISNIFELGDKEAQDIMIHRNNIMALDGSIPLRDILELITNEKYSRFPVYEENIDHIVGILHFKDAMRYEDRATRIDLPLTKCKDLLREPVFIPPTKKIDELFKMMQSEKLQMVIISDEYGQTSGLVSMEDILEEIVGNIMDEYDVEESFIKEKGQDEYIIEGKTPLEDLEERFGIDFKEETFETLNGFLISKMDKIPDNNEHFETDVDGYHFKILSVQNKMIQSVLVNKIIQ